MKQKFFGIGSVVTTLVALLSVSTACTWLLYQPKAPKCLQK